jgi:hypothetical protein
MAAPQEARDQAVEMMRQELVTGGMPADLASKAAAKLVDMAIEQAGSGEDDSQPD